MPKHREVVGQTFGRLTVLEEVTEGWGHGFQLLCRCSCGDTKLYKKSSVIYGNTSSCGCWGRESRVVCNTKHGEAGSNAYKKGGASSLYQTWAQMVQRCTNSKNKGYKNYGGRGISVCPAWRDSFAQFKKDMGDRPSQGLLEREKNDGDYTPENCRWATRTEQNRNRRSVRWMTFNGKTQCLADWAREAGLSYLCLFGRLKRGWGLEKALTTPRRVR